jgi:hypothetical protein
MIIGPVGAELFHADEKRLNDRHIEMLKLIVSSRSLAKEHKNGKIFTYAVQ